MRNQHYILDGKIPVPCDLLTWARWIEEHHKDKVVKQEYVGEFWVSTVFMGLDHNWLEQGPPLLFETMIFRETTQQERVEWAKEAAQYATGLTVPDRMSVEDAPMFRTPTWEMALETHAEAVEWARKQAH